MANQQSDMEQPQEELQNLKSLSVLLLKETIDRQQQVESLLQVKESLEIQLAGIAAEKSVSLETMKGMFSVFMETQVDGIRVLVKSLVRENGEKENEIGSLMDEINVLKFSRICQERDQLMREVDDMKKESKVMKEKVIELEENKILFDEKIRKLNENYNKSSDLVEEKEITIGNLMAEMDSRERLVMNLNSELMYKDGLIETLLRDNEEIEDAKVKLQKSNKILKGQNEQVLNLRYRVMEIEKKTAKMKIHYRKNLIEEKRRVEEMKQKISAYRSFGIKMEELGTEFEEMNQKIDRFGNSLKEASTQTVHDTDGEELKFFVALIIILAFAVLAIFIFF
ncbi:uncharacterized protein [Euphorbia lathyris]|uniref:uncharacterized protein n=1 Tax=Euphorbia lathyris TaxID=212925 RepID=UPI003313D4D1